MARQVKHSVTGELIDYKECFKVKVGSANKFFNNEAEYNEYIESKELKTDIIKAYRRLWFSMMTNGFKKEEYYGNMELAFSMIYEKYPAKFLLPRMKAAFTELDWVREKDFSTGKSKLLYMLKVLTGSFENDIIDYKQTLTKASVNKKEVDNNLFNLSKKIVVKKDVNSIEEFL